jgi:glycosyltransferase involved in cell wall biosynthesis
VIASRSGIANRSAGLVEADPAGGPRLDVPLIPSTCVAPSLRASAAVGLDVGDRVVRFPDDREVKLRIAQVSPLHESVPPKLYGGTERVVAFLAEELCELGHDVTLFATADSSTRAELVPCAAGGLRLAGCKDTVARHIAMLERVFERADDFDVIHFHTEYVHFPFARRHDVPAVTTLHGRLDIPDWEPLFRTYTDAPLVSISDAQREPMPYANWAGTVYHGLPPDLLTFHDRPEGYLAFLGRVSREKGLDRAIEIAARVGLPLKIAAKVSDEDRPYYEQEIRPLLSRADVEFVGEIGESEKDAFLGGAAALLFPINWPEPFGLVMIEAMACGTPVVAYRRGSVPEVMRDGVSGYVVDSVEEAAQRTVDALALPRAGCRAYFDERFTARRMAQDYVALFEAVIEERGQSLSAGRGAMGVAAVEADDGADADGHGLGDLGVHAP